MSRYRRISVPMWGDARFRKLSAPAPNARYLWIYLLTGPHTGPIPGLSTTGEAALAEALDWSLAKFRPPFAEIAAQGMAEADWRARVLFVPKAINHNAPESPNVVRAWRSYMAEIPECALKAKAQAMLKGWLEAKGKAWGEAFEEALGEALPQPLGESGTGVKLNRKEAEQEPPKPPDGLLDQAILWIEELNRITGLNFRPTPEELKPVEARLKDGFTLEQARQVITDKVAAWAGTEQAQYLRPSTLFGAKFQSYLVAAVNGSGKSHAPSRHVDAWREREPGEVTA